MKLIVGVLLVVTLIAGCSKKELACQDQEVVTLVDSVIKKSLMGQPDAQVKQIMSTAVSMVGEDAKKKELIEGQQKMMPAVDWDQFFPGVKLNLTNFVATSKNKETGKISCEATMTSEIFDVKAMFEKLSTKAKTLGTQEGNQIAASIYLQNMFGDQQNQNSASGFQIAYDAQPTEDGKQVVVNVTKSDVNNATVASVNKLAVTTFSYLMLAKIEKLDAGSAATPKEGKADTTAVANASEPATTAPNSAALSDLLLAAASCKPSIAEVYLSGSMPKERDNAFNCESVNTAKNVKGVSTLNTKDYIEVVAFGKDDLNGVAVGLIPHFTNGKDIEWTCVMSVPTAIKSCSYDPKWAPRAVLMEAATTAKSAPAAVVPPVTTPVTLPVTTPVAASTVTSGGSWSPSFDCAKVTTGQERLICSSKELSELDVKLSLVYRQRLDKTVNAENFKNSQREWRKFKRDACADVACMTKTYTARIEEITSQL